MRADARGVVCVGCEGMPCSVSAASVGRGQHGDCRVVFPTSCARGQRTCGKAHTRPARTMGTMLRKRGWVLWRRGVPPASLIGGDICHYDRSIYCS